MNNILDSTFPNPRNPRPFCQACVKRLLDNAHRDIRRTIRRKINVKIIKSGQANALTHKRFCCGYRILVNSGLLLFMNDAVDIFLFRTETISNTGEVIVPVDVSHEKAVEILRGMVKNYVENKYWQSAVEILEIIAARPIRSTGDGPSLSKSTLQYMKLMVEFTMAHELAHIVLGHLDRSARRSRQNLWEDEHHADEVGMVFVKSSIIAETHSDNEEMKRNMLQLQYSYLQISLAILFELIALVVRMAEKLGMAWGKSHPPSDVRYYHLRNIQIKGGMPEWAFTHPVAGMEAPDKAHENFRAITMDVLA